MASAIGAALGFDEPEGTSELPTEELTAPESGGNAAEALAMKQFKRATTPEAMATAMKDFLEACGLY